MGGVFSTDFTFIKHSVINNNIEGGVSSYSLVIKNSEVSNNTNGGIESRSLKASHVIVSNNIVEEGYANRIGGIKANFIGGSATISDSIITNNISDSVSGIAIGGGPDGGPLSITNSIISGNISRNSVGVHCSRLREPHISDSNYQEKHHF